MLGKLILNIFDHLHQIWENYRAPRIVSTFLILAFAITLVLVGIHYYTPINIWKHDNYNFFLAIDVSFTILLIFEILGLIFILPRSVADALGKQFEILSIILLRSAFKEFGNQSTVILNGSYELSELYPMLSDAFGALLIFLLIGFYYNKQKHERITKNERDQDRFIHFKKGVAFMLFICFLIIGAMDLFNVVQHGYYKSSLNEFYTLLIFTDVLILLYSLRYQSHYMNLFRYSSFTFATILIRLSLSAPIYLNVLIGILAGCFVVGVSVVYNYFRSLNTENPF